VTTTLELRAGPARVVLAPAVGGAIAAYEWNGMPVLRPTPDAALAAADVQRLCSFPLIPFSNRIADATLRWQGSAYPLRRYLPEMPHAIHGNGWRRAWNVLEREPARAALEFVHDAAGERAREWPFPYRGWQRFDLADNALTMTLGIENIGSTAFPFGLGWHPYFPRTAATVLGFAADAVWQTDRTVLPTRLERVPAQWSFAPPRPIADTMLDHCFVGWRTPATLRWPERRLRATIDADSACNHLVVYVPPERDYLAIEPVTHMTDAFNREDSGEHDTGTRALAPGAEFSCTMHLSVALDEPDSPDARL
jgi:aldose 1-epimerase